jgi:hypothetical protein
MNVKIEPKAQGVHIKLTISKVIDAVVKFAFDVNNGFWGKIIFGANHQIF